MSTGAPCSIWLRVFGMDRKSRTVVLRCSASNSGSFAKGVLQAVGGGDGNGVRLCLCNASWTFQLRPISRLTAATIAFI